MDTRKTLDGLKKIKYILALEGILAGILAGITVSIFRLLINGLENLRNIVIDSTIEMVCFFIAMWLIIVILLNVENNISGSGIPHVKGELGGQIDTVWYKVLISKIIGGACAIGVGLSIGREGPSVQIGAMSGKGISKILKRPATEERIIMTAGAGAGLAAAFNAPLAGAIFALEEIHQNLSRELLLAALAATISADFVSSYVFGLNPVFAVLPKELIFLKEYWLLIVLGIVLGITGWLYNVCINLIQKVYEYIRWTSVKIGIPILIAVGLAYKYPCVLGGGNSLVNMLAEKEFILSALVVMFLVKFVFSMVSFGSGTPGGIFLPLLVLGAIQGSIFANITGYTQYVDNFIIFGMAGYFTAIVRSPITGIILISEMTGSLSHLLALTLVCLISYVISDLLGTCPIYEQLLGRILQKRGKHRKEEKRKTILDSYVQAGSEIDGKIVQNIEFPRGVLIISVERDGEEIVPNGNTQLMADDNLLILCEEALIYETEKILNDKCRKLN